MGKIIFLDVDGTLVDYEGNLPESAVEAIRKARENGHKVYICTGRSKAEVYENIWEIIRIILKQKRNSQISKQAHGVEKMRRLYLEI